VDMTLFCMSQSLDNAIALPTCQRQSRDAEGGMKIKKTHGGQGSK